MIETRKKVNGKWITKTWPEKWWKALGSNKRGWEEVGVSQTPKINPTIEKANGFIQDGKLYDALEVLEKANSKKVDAEVSTLIVEVENKIGLEEEAKNIKEKNDSDKSINFDENLAIDNSGLAEDNDGLVD